MTKEIIRFASILLLSLAGCFLMVRYKSQKLAYIDMTKVYNDYKLTKDLDRKLKDTNQARKNILDSLAIGLKMTESSIRADQKNQELLIAYQKRREEYVMRKEQFEKDYEQQSQEYNGQILKQINQFTEEYRVSKGIDMLVGANGNGFIMAGNPDMDCSAEFIEFINKK